MKAAVWQAVRKMEVKDVPIPVIRPDEVLIKVKAVGVCGSDLSVYQGHMPQERCTPPLILGHEISGEIAAVGNGVNKALEIGTRVMVIPPIPCGQCYACREGLRNVCEDLKIYGVDLEGAFAEYAKAAAEMVRPLPSGLSWEEGAMVEPLAVAVHAVGRCALEQGDRVVVLGGGAVGTLIAMVCKHRGARVVVCELQDYRRKIIERAGLDCVGPDALADVSARFFGDRGVNLMFEATGTSGGLQQAVDHTRARGRIIQVGIAEGKVTVDLTRVTFAEITITGSQVFTGSDLADAMSLLASGAVRVDGLYQTYDLAQCDAVFDGLVEKRIETLKAIFVL